MKLNLKDTISFEENTNTHNECGRDQCLGCGKACDVSNIINNSIAGKLEYVDATIKQTLSSTISHATDSVRIRNSVTLQRMVRNGDLERVSCNSREPSIVPNQNLPF